MTDTRPGATAEAIVERVQEGATHAGNQEPEKRPRARGGADIAERYGLVAAWLILTLAFFFTEPNFRSTSTFTIIFGSQSTQLIVTLAVVVVLLAGEFDLSVGAVVSVASIMLVYFNGQHHWGILLALAAVLVIVVVIGAVNAALTLWFNVPSIIVTLGMATLITGVSQGVAGEAAEGGVSQGFVNTISHQWLGLPIAFYVALLIGIVLYYVIEHTPWGRHLLFVGRGREVARLAGIREHRYRAASLVVASTLAGVAGILLVGLTGANSPSTGDAYLLPAFAGAFLGSTTIKPGQFNVWGSFVAVYFLVTGATGLQLLGYTGWVENAFYGASLLVAVVATQVVARNRARLRKASS
jgi:ribose transport system permease protein